MAIFISLLKEGLVLNRVNIAEVLKIDIILVKGPILKPNYILKDYNFNKYNKVIVLNLI